MAEKKFYLGSMGPFLYDDTDLINDPDGDFLDDFQKSFISNGDVETTNYFVGVIKSIKTELVANEEMGTATVADSAATQADPAAIGSSDVIASDAGSVTTTDADSITTADADDTYGIEERDLINEIKTDYNLAVTLINENKADYNSAVTLINELKVDYNLLRADVTEVRTVLIGVIDYCDSLKSKINDLLTELRKTAGCGILAG